MTKTRTAIAACILAYLASPVLARNVAESQPAPDVDLGAFTARTITRMAIFDLRLADAPTAADHELVWLLLGIAEELAPQDEHIARLRLDAAFAMQDAEAVYEQTRRVLELDPEDEVSQLRLITDLLTREQTAGGRLRIYRGLLGEGGERLGLSPAVRSRLALDAALLLREQGDLDGFVRRLEEATTLDPTNKAAAALALAFYAENVDDPIGRLDLISNLLYADPVDPNIHDAIVRELAAGGAFEAATRFHNTHTAIVRAAGRELPETLVTRGLVLEWQLNGPASVAEALTLSLQVRRQDAQQNFDLLRREGLPLEEAVLPDEIRLPLYLDIARIVAADAAGDRATVNAASADLARSAAKQLEALQNPAVVGDTPLEQLELIAAQLISRVTMVRLWADVDLDRAREGVDALTTREAFDADTLAMLNGWMLLREGAPEEAITHLEPVAADRTFARLGLALAQIDAGSETQGLDTLASIAREDPLSLMGVWAMSRYERIAGDQLQFNGDAPRLTAWADAIPYWLDEMATTPQRFITLDVEPVKTRVDALGRTLLTVQIRNTSPVPLGFGSGSPISSRIMVVPRTDVGIESIAGALAPEVFDIGRKLRIMPLETFTATIWPDPGRTGYFMDLVAPGTASRTRWRVVQGYTLSSGGLYRPGPMGLTSETDQVVLRLPLPAMSSSIGELARRIASDQEPALPSLTAALRTKIHEFVATGVNDPVTNPIPAIQAAAQRYGSCSPRTRLMMACVLQSERFFAPMQPFEQVVRADTDPLVRAITLFTRVTDPADPLLAEALASEDARLARIAQLVKARLESERPSLSMMRPVQRQPQGR